MKPSFPSTRRTLQAESLEHRTLLAVTVAETEVNDTRLAADSVPFPTASNPVQITGSIGSSRDEDFFRIPVAAAATVKLDAVGSGGLAAKVSIEDQNGLKLAETEPNNGVNSQNFAVSAGQTLYVRVRGANASLGTYNVALSLTAGTGGNPVTPPVNPGPTAGSSVTESEPNDTIGQADPASFNSAGAAQLRGISTSDRDKDFFVVTPQQNGTLQVTVQAAGGQRAKAEITDSLQNQIGETEPNNGVHQVSVRAFAGKPIYIRMRSPNTTAAPYTVDVLFSGGAAATPVGAPVVSGRTTSGEWWVARAGGETLINQKWGNWSTAVQWTDVLTGDFSGDGIDDVLGRTQHGNWWLARSNGNQFVNESWGWWSPDVSWNDMQVADVDHDGDDDLVGRTSAGHWWVARSNRTQLQNEYWGSWSTAVTWRDVKVADIDLDGRDDVLGRTASGEWWVARSNGTTFQNQAFGWWSPSANWSDVSIADVNGDGRDDVIGRTSEGQWWVGKSDGSKLVNERWGAWSNAVRWEDVRVSDVNGDGRDDILGHTHTGEWWLATSTGTGYQNTKVAIPALTGVSTVLVHDINDDHREEVIVRLANNDWWVIQSQTGQTRGDRWGSWSESVTWEDIV